MSALFDGINKVLSGVAGSFWPSATLIKRGETVSTEEPWKVTESEPDTYPCKAQIDDGKASNAGDSDVRTASRHVMILRSSLEVMPEPNDQLTVAPINGSAETLTLVKMVERDPTAVYDRWEIES